MKILKTDFSIEEIKKMFESENHMLDGPEKIKIYIEAFKKLPLKMQIELLNKNINLAYADVFTYTTIKDLSKRIR